MKHRPSSRCDLITEKKKLFRTSDTPEIVIVVTVQFQSLCATHAPLSLLCLSKKSVPFTPSLVQHLHWNVLCVSFSVSFSSSSTALEPAIVYVKGAKIFGKQVKNLPQVFMQRAQKNRHPHQILSASCRHLETALPMEWHRLSAVPTRLSQNCHPKLLVEQIVFFVFDLSSFGPAQPRRRILSSITTGTIPSFRCSTLIRICCSVPSSPRHCKEPLQGAVLPTNSGMLPAGRAQSL